MFGYSLPAQRTFHFLEWRNYQCPQSSSRCQVPKIPFEGQKISFFLKFDQGIYIIKEKKCSIQDVIGVVLCPTRLKEKCVFHSTKKTSSFYDCKKCKACCHVLDNLLGTKNRHLCCLAMMIYIALLGRRVSTLKKKRLPHFEELFPSITTKYRSIYGIIVSTPHWLIQ